LQDGRADFFHREGDYKDFLTFRPRN